MSPPWFLFNWTSLPLPLPPLLLFLFRLLVFVFVFIRPSFEDDQWARPSDSTPLLLVLAAITIGPSYCAKQRGNLGSFMHLLQHQAK
jgi:hypothetical protein